MSILCMRFSLSMYFQVYRKLLSQFTHPWQVASSFVFLLIIILIIIITPEYALVAPAG